MATAQQMMDQFTIFFEAKRSELNALTNVSEANKQILLDKLNAKETETMLLVATRYIEDGINEVLQNSTGG